MQNLCGKASFDVNSSDYTLSDTAYLARTLATQAPNANEFFRSVKDDCSCVAEILDCVDDRELPLEERSQVRSVITGTHIILDEIQERVQAYHDAPHSQQIEWVKVPGFADFMDKVSGRLKWSMKPLNDFNGAIFRTDRERRIVSIAARKFGLELQVSRPSASDSRENVAGPSRSAEIQSSGIGMG